MTQIEVCSYCLECGKKIQSPVIVFDHDSKFCEECEIEDYEGKCSCSQENIEKESRN
jgi:hypothetical protein